MTDNHLYPFQTSAKFVTDEAWNVSWTDFDALEQKCREAGVTGVLVGFSEFLVESMIRLCERVGLPCCITLNQLEATIDMNKFKKVCEIYGIPVVVEHMCRESFVFTVIVKPVDIASSVGITVAYR